MVFFLSELYNVVGPAEPLFTIAGEDVILPCYIKPNTSAVDMTVEWFRLDQDEIVHLYKNHENRISEHSQSYKGRTALFLDELQYGNASLKLSTVQVSDEGVYKCFIESNSWYDDITVNVKVGGEQTTHYFDLFGTLMFSVTNSHINQRKNYSIAHIQVQYMNYCYP